MHKMFTNMCGYLNCAIFVWEREPLVPSLALSLSPSLSLSYGLLCSVRSKQNGNYAAFLLPNQGEIYLNRLDLASKNTSDGCGWWVVGGGWHRWQWSEVVGNGLIGLLGLPREAASAAAVRHINNWMAGEQHTPTSTPIDIRIRGWQLFTVQHKTMNRWFRRHEKLDRLNGRPIISR